MTTENEVIEVSETEITETEEIKERSIDELMRLSSYSEMSDAEVEKVIAFKTQIAVEQAQIAAYREEVAQKKEELLEQANAALEAAQANFEEARNLAIEFSAPAIVANEITEPETELQDEQE